MDIKISGSFKEIAEIRNFIQGNEEPYLYGSRGGYCVESMEDSFGDRRAALFLSEAGIPKKTCEEAAKIRADFIAILKKASPSLEISHS